MSLEDSCAHPDVQVGGPGCAPPTMWMSVPRTLRFQQMQPGPMPSSSAAAEAKSDEESTTDESSSSEMSFTAPASSRPETVLPVSKRAKAPPRDEGHPSISDGKGLGTECTDGCRPSHWTETASRENQGTCVPLEVT